MNLLLLPECFSYINIRCKNWVALTPHWKIVSSPLSTCKIIDCVSNFQTSCRLITNHTYIINGNGHVIVARQQCIKYLYSFLTHTAQLFDVAHGHG